MNKKYDVYVIGDISLDILLKVREFNISEEMEYDVDSISFNLGGMALNFALETTKLGLKTHFVGCIGLNDPISKILINRIKNFNLEYSFKNINNKYTGVTFVLTNRDNKRILLAYNGTNSSISLEQIDFEKVANSKFLYIGGYWYAVNFFGNPTLELFKFAKKHNVGIIMDIGPERKLNLSQRNQIYKLLKYIYILFSNKKELTELTNIIGIQNSINLLLEKGVRSIILHLGKNGALYASSKYKIVSAAPYKIGVKNATGAGDIFNAGFVYGMLNGWGVDKSLKFANKCGAFRAAHQGDVYPTIRDINNFFSH